MLQGSACHKTHEMLYNDKMAGTPLPNSKQTAELVVYNVDEIIKEAVEEDGAEPIPEKDKDVIYGDIINVETSYAENIIPHIVPIATEVEFIYTSKCGVDMLMYIDLIKQLDPDNSNSRSIVDYKISGKKWSFTQLAGSLQFILYTKALDIPHIEIHNLVRGSKKHPVKLNYKKDYTGELDVATNIRCLQTTYVRNEYNHLEDIIESAAKMISSGIFMPADPSSWVCNEKFCDYWNMCRGKK